MKIRNYNDVRRVVETSIALLSNISDYGKEVRIIFSTDNQIGIKAARGSLSIISYAWNERKDEPFAEYTISTGLEVPEIYIIDIVNDFMNWIKNHNPVDFGWSDCFEIDML